MNESDAAAFFREILLRNDAVKPRKKKRKTPKKASTDWPPDDPEAFFAEVRAHQEKEKNR